MLNSSNNRRSLVADKEYGDVINIPQEFILIKNKWQNLLLTKQLDLQLMRQVGCKDYVEEIEGLVVEMAKIRNRLNELENQINMFKQPEGGITDDSKHNE
tara:strand:- start:775 stop:1074 length:300 start_codon:yes stop_codon:yes gene_type:complete